MLRSIITPLLALTAITTLSAQDKEVVIIGTMHHVPDAVKHSYRPLLRHAIRYAPEAIYTEDIMPEDTLSLRLFTPQLLHDADSLSASEPYDKARFETLSSKRLDEMTHDDYSFLAMAYLQRRDRANYSYYKHLEQYGLGKRDKPSQEENGDLIFPLAISQGIRELYPMDSHHSDSQYNKAHYKALTEAYKNGDYSIYMRLYRKNNRTDIVSALFGRLGKHTNRMSTLQRYYLMNSARFVTIPTEYSETARKEWDDRNYKMAQHIATQIRNRTYRKNIIIVGAGHVISLRNMLNEIYPELKVICFK